MQKHRHFLVALCIIITINIGLFWWNSVLIQDLKPKEVSYLNDLPEYSIDSIAFDSQNRLWICGEFGVRLYDNGKLISSYPSEEVDAIKQTRENYSVVEIYVDRRDRPWLVADETLYVLDEEKWVVYSADFLQVKDWGISVLAFDFDNRVWIGTYQGGLRILDRNTVTVLNPLNSSLAGNQIGDIAVDQTGRVWVSTQSGLNIIDHDHWETINQNNSSLTSDFVHTVAFDKDNRAWIGTSEGLSVFDGMSWENHTRSNSKLVYGGVSSIHVAENGRIWLGNDDLVIENGKWKYYFEPEKLFEQKWHTNETDRQGNLWIFPAPYMRWGIWVNERMYFVPANVRLVTSFEISLHFLIASGCLSFMSLIVCGIWLAVLMKSSKGFWISLVITMGLGILYFCFWAFETVGQPSINQMRTMSQVYFVGNPGFIATILIMIIALSARFLGKTLEAEKTGLIIGWLFSVPVGFIIMSLAAFSLSGP